MVFQRRDHHATTTSYILHILFLVLTLSRFGAALNTVAGSPCESICSDDIIGTIQDDAVCLDDQYEETERGRNVRTCVTCLLNSTAVDEVRNESDVEWGLFSLRYTISSCMFGIPIERVSISSPCQVTCQSLNNTIGHGFRVNDTSPSAGLDFCTAGYFGSTTINKCAVCYGFIPQQLFVANFLQALHIACTYPPELGKPFYPDGNKLFNESLVAGPAPPSSNTGQHTGLHGAQLALAIALPIVLGVMAICMGCWCCFRFTRQRRLKMAASGRMSRLHEALERDSAGFHAYHGSPAYMTGADNDNDDFDEAKTYGVAMSQAPDTSKQQLAAIYAAQEEAREMESMTPKSSGKGKFHLTPKTTSPGVAQGRYSGHFPSSTPRSATFRHSQIVPPEADTPAIVVSSENVGPGEGQVQDHNLHEHYFGIAHSNTSRESIHGPSSNQGVMGGDHGSRNVNSGLGLYSTDQPTFPR